MCFILLPLDHSTQEILAQHASAAEQYSSALHKLSQINMTIGFMLNLLDKTRYVSVRGRIQFVLLDQKHRLKC
jgi:hypothetical protein